jgi:hypothetical protein
LALVALVVWVEHQQMEPQGQTQHSTPSPLLGVVMVALVGLAAVAVLAVVGVVLQPHQTVARATRPRLPPLKATTAAALEVALVALLATLGVAAGVLARSVERQAGQPLVMVVRALQVRFLAHL